LYYLHSSQHEDNAANVLAVLTRYEYFIKL
jgi:hypothetical protein